ncbi:unnamed protein product [Staurois parvus]|uniref:Uncharacterized protein n=1 Tax=Staurois parvus TaxID=386267 RepID=A0ABN9BME2_9NEOB|nr:unnamed protein product [Staurois parvus]
MKKDYLFAKFYKKSTFFFKMFGLFHLYSKIIKIPVVNKYHQNKVLCVSKKMLKNSYGYSVA